MDDPMNTNVTITAKGQMTVPKVLRDQLQIKPGDKCYAWVRGGELIIIPRNKPLGDLAGFLGSPPVEKAIAPEEPHQAMAEGAVDRYLGAQSSADDA